MGKLSIQEEKELISFIKDWLKSHGFNQKDLANELDIKSSRTSEIILKIKELYKKGGMFNIAKKLIKIEQKWLNNIKNDYLETKQTQPYNQLDLEDLYYSLFTSLLLTSKLGYVSIFLFKPNL